MCFLLGSCSSPLIQRYELNGDITSLEGCYKVEVYNPKQLDLWWQLSGKNSGIQDSIYTVKIVPVVTDSTKSLDISVLSENGIPRYMTSVVPEFSNGEWTIHHKPIKVVDFSIFLNRTNKTKIILSPLLSGELRVKTKKTGVLWILFIPVDAGYSQVSIFKRTDCS